MILAQTVFVLLLTGVWATSGVTEVENGTMKPDNFPESSGVWATSGVTEVENGTMKPDNFPESSEENCSYSKVLDYLNLTKDNKLYIMSRPTKHHQRPTMVYLDMVVYAILDVRETDQTFVSYAWIYMSWDNDYIKWNPTDFCGISSVAVPHEGLWKPDLTIEEMVEKDKAPPSPLLRIHYFGSVFYKNDQVIVSTCQMHVYKFPFDTQSCNITFKSVIYTDTEINYAVSENNTEITKWSTDIMQTQYEWVFLGISVNRRSEDKMDPGKTSIVYTITMKRQSILYCANFLVPILFLMILDLASFLIPDNGGEKLSFKVTVLLAVTVMQLLLNEILPSSTETIPLVVLYCIGIFALMLLSLMETILVMYLVEKDSESIDSEGDLAINGEQNDEKTKVNSRKSFTVMNKCCWSAAIHDHETDQNTPSLEKDSSSQRLDVSLALDLFSHELDEVKKTVSLLSSRKENIGYWTKLSKKINKVFFVFYVGGAFVFLTTIASLWIIEA